MVSNHPDDAWLIEQRASGPNDLLRDGGASISNLVSGGATRAIATNSQLSRNGQGLQMDGFSLYLVNPYNVTRGCSSSCWTVILEWFQARDQRQRGVEPRIARGMPFPVLRASTTTIMRDMLTDLVIGEMYRGTPTIYADYLGYDEVAHHAGPERPEAMEELIKVDRQVRTIVRADGRCPAALPPGAGVRPRAEPGRALRGALRAVARGARPAARGGRPDRARGHRGRRVAGGPLNAFATEVLRSPGRAARVARRALRESTTDGVVELGRSGEGRHVDEIRAAVARTRPAPRSSSWPHPATSPTSTSRASRTARRWRRSRSCIRAWSRASCSIRASASCWSAAAERGAVAIGRQGVNLLDARTIIGEDPLAVFGPHAADNLRRLDSFTHVGDLLVNSTYDPTTEEIAPFEHQVGAHGGMGGAQTKAFLLYPAELEPTDDPVSIVGAEAVNAKIRDVDGTSPRARGGPPSPPATPVKGCPRRSPRCCAATRARGTAPPPDLDPPDGERPRIACGRAGSSRGSAGRRAPWFGRNGCGACPAPGAR